MNYTSLKEKNILVTGAAGFIGSNLTDVLLEKGASVIGLDNMFNGKIENLKEAKKNPKFKFYKADVRDYDMLLHVMKDVDIIFHEAAFTSVPQSIEMPALCNDVNVTGMVNILNAARIRDVKKILFASSSSVYGDSPTLPKKEDMHCQPISPYGVSKLAAESYMVAYNKVYGLNTTSLRYFNVFGPRQQDSPYSGVISIFISKIFKGENPLIFGDGTQSRDFTYVKDVIKANILAAESKSTAGKYLNIASGKPISMNDLTIYMLELMNRKDLKIEHGPKRTGDILHSFGDQTLAKELLGFTPDYDARSGFKEYYEISKNAFGK